MHRIQDNSENANFNTKETHKEMKKALVNEKSFKDRLRRGLGARGDWSLTCLVMWFFLVALMFIIDMQLSGPTALKNLN